MSIRKDKVVPFLRAGALFRCAAICSLFMCELKPQFLFFETTQSCKFVLPYFDYKRQVYCVGQANNHDWYFWEVGKDFPFASAFWLDASSSRKCRPLARNNNMAASEGDHRVQKSPAAAQRPPHLRALEVFTTRVQCFAAVFLVVSLTFYRVFHPRAWLSLRACQDDPLAFEGAQFRCPQPIAMEVQVKETCSW